MAARKKIYALRMKCLALARLARQKQRSSRINNHLHPSPASIPSSSTDLGPANPLRCFLCHEEYLKANPNASVSKLPSRPYSDALAQLIFNGPAPAAAKTAIRRRLETKYYCSACVEQVRDVVLIGAQMEKLAQLLLVKKAEVAQRLLNSCRSVREFPKNGSTLADSNSQGDEELKRQILMNMQEGETTAQHPPTTLDQLPDSNTADSDVIEGGPDEFEIGLGLEEAVDEDEVVIKLESESIVDVHVLQRLGAETSKSQVPTPTPFVCPKCDLVLNTKTQLRTHRMRCRRKTIYFLCKICGQRFTQTQIGQHVKKAHNAQWSAVNVKRSAHNAESAPARPGKCVRCKITFDNLLDHILTAHKPLFPCEVCGRTFGTNYGRNSHVNRVHLKIKDTVCQICERRFASNMDLNRHVKLHRGQVVRKHGCPSCPKLFSSPVKLSDHVEAVHGNGQPKHICDVCGKAFPIRNYLYIHLRSHESPAEKEARRTKARLAREARLESGKPILVAKGRPRVK